MDPGFGQVEQPQWVQPQKLEFGIGLSSDSGMESNHQSRNRQVPIVRVGGNVPDNETFIAFQQVVLWCTV